MSQVQRKDITDSVRKLGINEGDIVLTHSSFKSLGTVEGGAESVIGGFLDALGENGTLVLPTFCQKNFRQAYETWYLDKESDVGYLTNYFRKREGSLRSDQATHSVAAAGRHAYELTKTHGHTHKRFGNMGDTPFSADSPFEKMYKMNAKIVLLGVSPLSITFRHYAEYCYIENVLKSIEHHPEYEHMKGRLWAFGKPGVWPHLNNVVLLKKLEDMNLVTKSICGNAVFTCVSSKDYVDLALKLLENFDESVLWRRDDAWDTDAWIRWTKEIGELRR